MDTFAIGTTLEQARFELAPCFGTEQRHYVCFQQLDLQW